MMRQFRNVGLGYVLGLLSTVGVASAGYSQIERLERIIDDARDQNAALTAVIHRLDSRSDRKVLGAMAENLDSTLYAAASTVDDLNERPARPRGPIVTSDADFGRILGAMNNEAFGEQKIQVLASAMPGRYFTTGQVVAVMNAITFDKDRVDAAAMLYPLVVDKGNWYTVYSGLTFNSSREALRDRTQ